MRGYVEKAIIGVVIVILVLVGYFINDKVTEGYMPACAPKIIIKHQDKPVPTKNGEFNWGTENGGNSYLAGPSYDVGKKVETFTAKSGDDIDVSFGKIKPKEIRILNWPEKDVSATLYGSFSNAKSCKIILPKESGEYIYEVQGWWNNDNFSSDIFRVEIK